MRVLLLAAVVSLMLVSCSSDPQLRGIVRTPTPSVGEAALPEAGTDGALFPLTADEGQILLVYFGFTSCPDVCPTTLADTRRAIELLGDDGTKVDVAMATVDPERDTDAVVTSYLQSFIPDAHALRTDDPAQLETAAAVFGASYQVDPDVDGEYVVTHTGALYAVDDQGDLLVTWPFGTTTEDLLNDLEILIGRL